MSLLKISYHYISSVTVSSSNTHPVCAGCMLPRHVLLGHLDSWRWDRLVILKRWNGITTLCCAQFQKVSKMFNFRVSFHLENAKWWIYICSVTLLQIMSNKIKSHELPRQGIGPALSTSYIPAVVSKVSSSQKTTIHEAFIFWYHINKIHTHRSTRLL